MQMHESHRVAHAGCKAGGLGASTCRVDGQQDSRQRLCDSVQLGVTWQNTLERGSADSQHAGQWITGRTQQRPRWPLPSGRQHLSFGPLVLQARKGHPNPCPHGGASVRCGLAHGVTLVHLYCALLFMLFMEWPCCALVLWYGLRMHHATRFRLSVLSGYCVVCVCVCVCVGW
jgi:hypothetical protein